MLVSYDPHQYKELLLHLCNTPDSPDLDLDKVCLMKFNVDFQQFSKIADSLLPFAIIAQSRSSGKIYQGFAVDNHWLANREIDICDSANNEPDHCSSAPSVQEEEQQHLLAERKFLDGQLEKLSQNAQLTRKSIESRINNITNILNTMSSSAKS